MNTALILSPTEASFQVIAGMPLIQRTLLSVVRSGFERVAVVSGQADARVQQVCAADARLRGVEIVDQPTRSIRDGQVAVIPSDCLVTTDTLIRVYDTHLNGRPIWVDEGGAPIALCGAAALAQFDGTLLGDTNGWMVRLRTLGDPAPSAANSAACLRVTDAASARVAETALFAQLRASTADSDGPLARWIDRSVSQWLSRRLVHTSLRPNHITIIGTTVGLLAAWSLAQGRYGFEVVGTLLFLVATVIDGCDGEVARLKFQETPFGHVFDITTDNLVHVAIFIGLGAGQYRQHPDENYALLLSLLLAGFACASAATYWCLLREPQPVHTAPQTRKGKLRDLLLRGFAGLMNRDFAYLLFALALVGKLSWFVWGAAFGTFGYAAGLFWVHRWRAAA